METLIITSYITIIFQITIIIYITVTICITISNNNFNNYYNSDNNVISNNNYNNKSDLIQKNNDENSILGKISKIACEKLYLLGRVFNGKCKVCNHDVEDHKIYQNTIWMCKKCPAESNLCQAL